MQDSPRWRRLRSDERALQNLRAESSIIDFESNGSRDRPAECYLIRFRGQGAWRPDGSAEIVLRDQHEFRVRLGAGYPRMMPELSWKSPIFHPNISSSGFVCLGGYGTYWAPSLNLDELCVMLWDMVRYANFDVSSPYNREAALWAKTQRTYPLPLDARPLRDRRAGVAATRPASGWQAPPLHSAVAKAVPPEIVFLDDVVVAEVVPTPDSELLIIE